MTEAKAQKAKEYEKIKNKLSLLNLALSLFFVLACFVIGSNGGLSTWFTQWINSWSSSVWITVAAYGAGVVFLSTLLFLPLKFYSSFTLEHKYELSNETVGGWFFDLFKSTVIDLVVTILMLEVLYALLRHTGEFWWLYAAALWIVFAVLVGNLFPVLILPLFYKLKPVEDKSLVDNLIKMAESVQAKVLGVYEMDMSRKTKKANAMLAGLGNTKRIIFGDTILKQYSQKEIEVILAHELGHFYHKHTWKLIFFSTIATFIGLYIAHNSLVYFVDIIGFQGLDDVANFPLLILSLSLFFFITMPLSNAFSRYCERQSDRFALDRTQDTESFISSMEKLAEQNLSDKEPNAFIEFCLHSHPSIGKRIKMAQEYKSK